MDKKCLFGVIVCLFAFVISGCGEQGKIDAVKKTVIPNCEGKTMEALAADLLQNPLWGYEEGAGGKQFVMVNGTIAGDSLPAWIKSQKVLDATFRFALDPKTGKFDPSTLDGLPSLTSPEGIFQMYKSLVCS
ncbi:MAG: hypothetical protein LBD42_08900 [Desulfovibrio sp.]|jgi:hypothetical protein|nr:hypothetical protein [Desulfovibrio sp.]